MSKNINLINKDTTYLQTGLQNKEYLNNLMTQKINELYIMTRFKFLSMYSDDDGNSHWSTIQSWNLNDYHVKKHLLTETTLGVFSGRYLTKFICFDVDSPSLDYSKKLVQLLMFTLIEEFNVPAKYLHISESGKKGYHVELFFSDALSLTLVEGFHKVVLAYINNTTEIYGDIEFRPSFTQGVKIPLSKHRGTGNFCAFVDPETFKVINDPYYLLKIEQMDVGDFKEKVLDSMAVNLQKGNYFTLAKNKAEETEVLLHETKLYKKSSEEFTSEMEEILIENHLLRNGSRNNATFYLSLYLLNQGQSKEETTLIIQSILNETWVNHRHLIGSDTSKKFMLDEVDRITEYVFNKSFSKKNKTFRLYESEILSVLDLPTKILRTLAFSLLLQGKMYAKQNGHFYMAYSVMAKMGNTKNRTRVLNMLLRLQDLGFLEIIQRSKKNKAMTYELNKNKSTGFAPVFETNIYKLTLDAPNENEPYLEIDSDAEITLVETVIALVDEQETKKRLPINQFYSEYKTEYAKVKM